MQEYQPDLKADGSSSIPFFYYAIFIAQLGTNALKPHFHFSVSLEHVFFYFHLKMADD